MLCGQGGGRVGVTQGFGLWLLYSFLNGRRHCVDG